MALPRFSYLIPKNLKEACLMLAEHGDKARILAGGTDLLIRMKRRIVQPEYIIGISNIPHTDYIHIDHLTRRAGTLESDASNRVAGTAGQQIVIGANAKLAAVAQNPDIQRYFPALAYAASVTATVQIRNMGTVIGNICNASPAADTATPLLVYDASVVIMHSDGQRNLPLSEFFHGPGITALASGEIVKDLIVPLTQERSGSNYQKLSARSKVDIAAVGVSACLMVNETEIVTRARIAIGAVSPVPKRVPRAEKSLEGKRLTQALVEQVAQICMDEAAPITDTRATAIYRKKMVYVLTQRAINSSMEQIRTQ
ncbi:MAG: xanthine dehydrogenase family protein subunit M [Dehalococcoidia bacterium]|nr:xanthine dehydrogenase family protein subunit M [Dehalococcoidia bacterium]